MGRPRGGNRVGGPRPQMPQGPPPMGMPGQMPGMPMPNAMPMPAQPMMPGMPGMPGQPGQPGQPMNEAQDYQMKSSLLLPSIQPNNRNYKQKVGELIFPYISKMVPQDRVPRVTGMLIELPLEQIREYLSNYQVLTDMVGEAMQMIQQQV